MREDADRRTAATLVVGGGAAGLATAIFAARHRPGSIVILDGARSVGAKILVSGGGRCNVTNAAVTPDDFPGGNRHLIRRVLRAFPVDRTVAFFREIGVPLHEEDRGRLFPDSNRARTVLDALLGEAMRVGVRVVPRCRVERIEVRDEGFAIATTSGAWIARRVVLATGGMSLPGTGSDGSGYRLAAALGHSVVPTTPALVPLVLDGDFHARLSGISHEASVEVRAEGVRPARLRGPLLWTHFGVSGPVVLDASRFWHRARLEGRAVRVTASFLPEDDAAAAERRLISLAADHPRASLRGGLTHLVPARVGEAVLEAIGIAGHIPLAHLSKEDRRKLAQAMTAWPLPVRESRGYRHAEVTAGGVPLEEVDAATMESRACAGLYLVGEILDVDGRVGGFNFQWAWSSAWVAGHAIAARAAEL